MANKRLKKTIETLVDLSFDGKNIMKENYVKSVVKTLKSLPNSSAILALDLYVKGLKRRINMTTLKIETAVNLSSSEVQEVLKMVKEKFPVNSVQTSVSPNLLGGLKMQIGDMVYNDTLANRVNLVKGAING